MHVESIKCCVHAARRRQHSPCICGYIIAMILENKTRIVVFDIP